MDRGTDLPELDTGRDAGSEGLAAAPARDSHRLGSGEGWGSGSHLRIPTKAATYSNLIAATIPV